MRSVRTVVPLVLAQGVQQMRLVVDQRAVEQFASAVWIPRSMIVFGGSGSR
jgi:hypothetical protein